MLSLRSAQGRAILAGAVLVVLLVSVATLAVWRTRDIQQQHETLEHTSAEALALERAHAQFSRQQAVLASLVFSDDPSLVDRYHEAGAQLEHYLMEARASSLTQGEADDVLALDDLTERFGQFNEKLSLGLPILLEADPQTRVQLATTYMSEMIPEADAIIADLGEMAHEAQQELAAERAAADRAADTTLWLLIGSSAAAFLVTAGTMAMLMVSVIRPLAALRASARAITASDPEARAKVAGPEEVASLARDFNEMTDALAAKTQELEVRAITDGLTGLYNHAHFYQRLTEEIERSQRYKRGFAVVMLDVDSFKHYNDSRGHQAGDMVLHLIADCIRAGVRGSDLAFRYGGDEFATILLDADSPAAEAIVKRMNRDISRRLKELNDSAAGWLRLSAGVACFPEGATSADELVRIADAALYGTKRARTPA